jgi:hypothetical protein
MVSKSENDDGSGGRMKEDEKRKVGWVRDNQNASEKAAGG